METHMLRKLDVMDLVRPSVSLTGAAGDIDARQPLASFGDILDAQFQNNTRPLEENRQGDPAPLQRAVDGDVAAPLDRSPLTSPRDMREENRGAEPIGKEQAAEPVRQKDAQVREESSAKKDAPEQTRQRRGTAGRESAERNEKNAHADGMQSLLAPRLDALLSLLKNMQGFGLDKNESAKLMSSIKDALSKKNADPGMMRELAERLGQLIKKLSDNAGGKNALPAMALLKNEAERALDMLKSRNKKSGTAAVHDESARREARVQVFDRMALGLASKEDRKEQGTGSNANNSFTLQFAKNAHQAERQAPAQANIPRAPLFDEQLQNLMQGARVTVRDGQNASLSLQLRPESLGRVTVNLGLEQGTLSGRFLVENMDAKQALIGQMDAIIEDLRGVGISVGDFQVNVRGGEDRAAREEQWKGAVVTGAPLERAGASYEMPVMMRHAGAIDVII